MTIEEWSVEGYGRMRERLMKYCNFHSDTFDEDVYHHTLMKVLERELQQGGMADPTPEGIDNYIFRAFTVNMLREKQYPRVARTTVTDDLSKFDRPDEEGGDLYYDLCVQFGVDVVDAFIDGAPVDAQIVGKITDYVKSYV